ncbi:hypothetical protein BJ508DRAFT_314533 [Ascobolus immersus RN42]|uniref:Uncharacterized protein n=1 Tax=Ascobolus immersus RN42 TaxID=1160509 RepID=A0A3N4HSL2_ASCIM|nr:hypothetical protein BJ508DRAFT_314533 [Ascobolus immersus RN42]
MAPSPPSLLSKFFQLGIGADTVNHCGSCPCCPNETDSRANLPIPMQNLTADGTTTAQPDLQATMEMLHYVTSASTSPTTGQAGQAGPSRIIGNHQSIGTSATHTIPAPTFASPTNFAGNGQGLAPGQLTPVIYASSQESHNDPEVNANGVGAQEIADGDSGIAQL